MNKVKIMDAPLGSIMRSGASHGGHVYWVKEASAADFAQFYQSHYEKYDNGSQSVYSTWQEAVNACVANVGDVIYLSEGYTLTISDASGLDLNKAGVCTFGLGVGDSRPKITFDTADTADLDVGADDQLVDNVVFVNDVDGLNEPIDIEANVDRITFSNCEFRDDTASKQTDRWFQTAATNTGLQLINCKHVGSDTAGATSFITITGGSKHVIKGLVSNGDFSAGNIELLTTLTGDLLIEDCTLENANAVDVNVEGNSLSSTGWIRNCSMRLATDGQTTWVNNVGAITIFNSFGADNSGEAGTRIGTASSGDVEADVAEILTDTGTTIPALHTVPSADATANTNMRDVIGNKTDAAATGAVSTTESLMAYAKQNVTNTEAAATSLNVIEYAASTAPAVMVNNDVIFTIAGGPIEVVELISVCVTDNDGTASTLQYSHDPTAGAATTFSAASASLASVVAGASVVLQGTTLATAPLVNASGAGLTAMGGVGIILQAGTISLTIGVGSTTGTWSHYLRYKPFKQGTTVT